MSPLMSAWTGGWRRCGAVFKAAQNIDTDHVFGAIVDMFAVLIDEAIGGVAVVGSHGWFAECC